MTSRIGCRLAGAALAVALTIVPAQPAQARAQLPQLDAARLEQLTKMASVTRGDCLVAVAGLVWGRKAPHDPVDLAKKLVARGIVRPGETSELGRIATRGYACLVFKRAIGEDGGLMGRVFQNSEHYAYRHLEYLDLVPSGGSWVPLTGPELISLVQLSKKHLRDEGRRAGE